MFEEVVRSVMVDADVFAHRDQLRSRQVVKGDIIVE